MIPQVNIDNNLDTFKMANNLLKNPSNVSFSKLLEEANEKRIQEVSPKLEEKETTAEEALETKKKKSKQNSNEELPNVSTIIQNTDNKTSRGVHSTYALLNKFKENKQHFEEEMFQSPRQQILNNAHNVAGQALIQPVYDQGQRRQYSKSELLALWEKFIPIVTEDITKKSIRVDIPLLNDVQALVLRMHPDRSVTASLLGSKEMGELIKNNKDKLNNNLKHHRLSLRDFNFYESEVLFNNESGSRKKKRKEKQLKTPNFNLI
ncbi:MAG: hypothetical protein HYY52_03850 [Candidatus Melainabacteria bacterium]|nr:hypothetical protein [Candidatus Melainabacteria bacterium]